MGRKFGFSFSWKRALGVSAAKSRISRAVGVPLTKQGRQRKFGQAMGCVAVLTFMVVSALGFQSYKPSVTNAAYTASHVVASSYDVAKRMVVVPKGATAQCKDGTYSFAISHRGACSHHKGVAKFYK